MQAFVQTFVQTLIEMTVETFVRTIVWAIAKPFVEPFVETFVETIIRLPSILVLHINRALSRASRRVFTKLGRVRTRRCYLLQGKSWPCTIT